MNEFTTHKSRATEFFTELDFHGFIFLSEARLPTAVNEALPSFHWGHKFESLRPKIQVKVWEVKGQWISHPTSSPAPNLTFCTVRTSLEEISPHLLMRNSIHARIKHKYSSWVVKQQGQSVIPELFQMIPYANSSRWIGCFFKIIRVFVCVCVYKLLNKSSSQNKTTGNLHVIKWVTPGCDD